MNNKTLRKKKHQKTKSRSWVTVSIVSVFVVLALLVFYNRQSEDNGAPRPISRLNTQDFHSLAFSHTEPDTIFFGHHGGMQVSYNGGKDWQTTSLANADAMALAIPQSKPQVMYAAGHDVFFKSTDAGQNWESINTNLPGTDIHGFAVDPENADTVYANVVGLGIFGSKDGGNTWEALSENAPASAFNLTVGPDSQTLFVAAGKAGLWQSQDGGRTWIPVQNAPDNGAIAVSYVNERLYASTLGDLAGLYVSQDNGQNWKPVGLNGTFLAIAVSSLDPNHIAVVNDEGEVFATRDGGVTWSEQ